MLLLSHLLKRFIKVGTLTVTDAHGKKHVFRGAPGPEVAFRITDRRLHLRLFLNPDLALGEGYMNGGIQFEGCTIYDFLDLFLCQSPVDCVVPSAKGLVGTVKDVPLPATTQSDQAVTQERGAPL